MARRTMQRVGAMLAVGAVALPAIAQDDPQRPRPRYELTPYAAYRFGGEFEQQLDDDGDGDADENGAEFELREGNAYGLILDIRTDAVNTQWEVLYAHQPTVLETLPSFTGGPLLDIDVDYLQFGGTFLFDNNSDTTVPFIAMTAGLARFEPGPSSIDAENYLSGSLGGGVHLRANRRVGVRLEARAFLTLVESDSTLFCVSSPATNACALSVEGKALFQLEARAGVVIRF